MHFLFGDKVNYNSFKHNGLNFEVIFFPLF